jgi:integrase
MGEVIARLGTDAGDIAQALQAWSVEMQARGVRDRRRAKADVLRMADEIGWARVNDIDYDSVMRFVASIDGEPQTVRNMLSRLSAFEEFCVRSGRKKANVSAGIPRPKGETGDGSRALTWDEVRRVVAAAREAENTDRRYSKRRTGFYMAMAYLGLRPAELERLTWADFDLEAEPPRLEMPGSKAKNKRSRGVVIAPELAAELRTMRGNAGAYEPVFTSRPHARTFKADLKRAGIADQDERGRPATMTSFRKALVTGLGAEGTPEALITAHMRHSSLAITQTAYKRQREQKIFEEVSKLPRCLELEGGEDVDNGAGEDGETKSAVAPPAKSDTLDRAIETMKLTNDIPSPAPGDTVSIALDHRLGAGDMTPFGASERGSTRKPPRGLEPGVASGDLDDHIETHPRTPRHAGCAEPPAPRKGAHPGSAAEGDRGATDEAGAQHLEGPAPNTDPGGGPTTPALSSIIDAIPDARLARVLRLIAQEGLDS